jgi:hypothetical protein
MRHAKRVTCVARRAPDPVQRADVSRPFAQHEVAIKTTSRPPSPWSSASPKPSLPLPPVRGPARGKGQASAPRSASARCTGAHWPVSAALACGAMHRWGCALRSLHGQPINQATMRYRGALAAALASATPLGQFIGAPPVPVSRPGASSSSAMQGTQAKQTNTKVAQLPRTNSLRCQRACRRQHGCWHRSHARRAGNEQPVTAQTCKVISPPPSRARSPYDVQVSYRFT